MNASLAQTDSPQWWDGKRRVHVFVDNDSWILPYAERLVGQINNGRDEAVLYREYEDKTTADIAFYLGCITLTPADVLAQHKRNLVPHASDLPKGRGFAPLFWQVLEGASTIPICLFEANDAVDSGPIYLRDEFGLEGHELYPELRTLQGEAALNICLRYLNSPTCPVGVPQVGEPTHYKRRTRKDDQLDPEKTIADQFDLLRILSGDHFHGFFNFRGHRYSLHIEKDTESGN